MRSKAPLALIEQAVMLLVFSLAAVLCMKAFVWADAQSAENAARDGALQATQNAAETLKHHRGDFAAAAETYGGTWDGAVWVVCYDETWRVTGGEPAYTLRAEPAECEPDYLGRAAVAAYQGGQRLAELEVCWQEVSSGG